MKKILAILLALVLVLANFAFAMATSETGDGEGGETPATTEGEGEGAATAVDIAKELGNPAPAPAVSFELTKTYTLEGIDPVNPADELAFTVSDVTITNSSDNTRTGYAVTIANVEVEEGAESATITVQLPVYDLPGVYSYEITEDDTGIAGVDYLEDTLYLNVTIASNEAKNALYIAGIAVHKGSDDGEKIDEFENTYTAGSLTVSKEVTGNMADYTKDFPFTVTFTIPENYKLGAPITISYPDGQDALTTVPAEIAVDSTGEQTATFTLKHGQSVTFNNIPKDVAYVVEETDSFDYTKSASGDSGTIADAAETAEFTNDWNITPDTGITLEALPYVLILTLVMAGAALLVIRKREDF